jgi:hypothetical protein
LIKLKRSKALGRKIRQDDIADLGISTWTLVRGAIKSGKTDEALELIDYELALDRSLFDSMTMSRDMLLSRAASFDEKEVEKLHRERFSPWVKEWLNTIPGVEESLQRFTEQFRGHGILMPQNLIVTEEPDRYVMRLDPCGTGGRLRRTRSVGATKKAYPWSWSKSGVCYYCTHCAVFQEILPIEMRGYPICVTQYADDPKEPCLHLYYKKPELIPDEYFTRIGKTPWRLKQR